MLHDRILKRMRELNLSTDGLATLMEVERQTFEKWLRGKQRPSKKNRTRLAYLLEVHPLWLETGTHTDRCLQCGGARKRVRK